MIYLIVPIIGLIIVFVAYNRLIKKYVDFFKKLGCQRISYLKFPYIEAYLEKDGFTLKLGISGYRSNFSLFISLPLEFKGFLRLRKAGVLEKLWANPFFKEEGLLFEYDDENWFKQIIHRDNLKEELSKTFIQNNLKTLTLKEGEIKLEWYIRRGPWEVSEESIESAIKDITILKNLVAQLPYSSIGDAKEKRRSFFSIYFPVLITLTLVTIGVLGGFYKYKPLCIFEAAVKGFLILAPFVIAYSLAIMLWYGGRNTKCKSFVRSLFVGFICSIFINLFFLTYVNGKFDHSSPKRYTDHVSKKYRSSKRGYRVELADFSRDKLWCDFNVSKNFYQTVNIGTKVEFWSKEGFLGIEWLYSGLRISEDPSPR